jgi:uracil-DNA glycosylase family 4
MRNALTALTDELRRLKAAGVKTVAVSDESVAALRRVVAARKAGSRKPETGKSDTAEAPPRTLQVSEPSAPTIRTQVTAIQNLLPPPPTVAVPAGDKQTRWNALLEFVRNDPTCQAHVRPGKRVVLGVGNLDATIMFVGEAPGAEEEIQGEPFVGPAGQLLTKMILGMGVKRGDVYIGNIMNWRPELPTAPGAQQVGNRAPTEAEIRYCLPYLRAQIEVVNPAVLVALGATATQGLLGFGSFKALGDVRGKWHEFSGKPLMVTYHPSYILREPTNRKKRLIWDDLLKVMERAALPISEKQRAYFLDR